MIGSSTRGRTGGARRSATTGFRGATLVAVVVAMTTIGMLPGVAGAQTADDTTESGTLAWTDCAELDPQGTFAIECATLTVPVDHDEPDGPTLDLAVRRIATDVDPSERLGSLVINPGGPGGPALGILPAMAASGLFAGWDLVAPDPRGVGDSAPLACEDAVPDPAPPEGNPFVDVDEANADIIRACLASDGEVFSHLGTVTVAKDLDLLRDALGEDQLDYLGFSYGTHLGAVYADLFGDRVGRFVLDGPVLLDSVVDATLEQIAGFDDAIDRFDAGCAVEEQCVLADYGARSVWRHLAWRLGEEPMSATIDDPALGVSGEFTVDTVTLDNATALAIYVGRAYWGVFAQALLDATWGDAELLWTMSYLWDSGPYSAAAGLGVLCADDPDRSVGPTEAQQLTYQEILDGNTTWAFQIGAELSQCRVAPVSDESVPDLSIAEGETNPMLVIAKTHDPATPYSGALDFMEAVGPGRLLTVVDDGHTAVADGNTCVDATTVRFLATGELPPEGAVCYPDGQVGVNIEPVEDGWAVLEVVPGSPADGIVEPGDLIVAWNGEPVPPGPTVPPRIGDEVVLTLVRADATLDVAVVVRPPAFWLPDD
ncbi:MAG: alpha/beta fold hydrolase [Actinomycetota bacterium]|nr:alpha/beta fold hydrolase [Actinomycetota bacterium]